ncbi:MAG: hypothetical protein M1453_07265 [Acidobacteria bacterium]|nr:hypothetical protein [Acidobacteriota bacterium]MCL5287776.1 hypothetical protein [Acidobacteriota bacterium]
MPFRDESRIWVIFDTSTRPAYYLDVHNLLALPNGATIRYEYREKYLSDPAKTAALLQDHAPRHVLFFYGQSAKYQRGEPAPKTGTVLENMLWVPTRIGEMLCIPPKEGDNFHFDLKLTGYPNSNSKAKNDILEPLIASKDVPFNKWISISDMAEEFRTLQEGKDDQKWAAIVSAISQYPFQFAGDAFWRLEPPRSSKRGKTVLPKYSEDFRRDGERNVVRQIKTVYPVHEGESYSLEISSQLSNKPRSWNQANKFYAVVESTNKPILNVIGEQRFDLRQYVVHLLKFKGSTTTEVRPQSVSLRFTTNPTSGDWESGPNFELFFELSKNWFRVVFGSISLFAGILFSTWGQSEISKGIIGGLPRFSCGLLLLFVSYLLLWDKLPREPK